MNFSDHIKSKNPFVISGPCSAETREQVLEIGRQVSQSGKVNLFRAGIWKPRTNPGSFEGIGEKGLDWLLEVKEKFDLPVCTEVATAKHVELCLNKKVDVIWIGARTTVNPFSVQEIADSLRGVDIPVMVKNPINPDLKLWIGAIERLKKSGVKEIAAIHRGFSHGGKSKYRNRPMWGIPIQFRSLMPEIPLLCDPSHIGGKRDLILKISQRAIDLGMNGLMIESHIDPDNAWSDSEQQVTPDRLMEILGSLKIKSLSTKDPDFLRELRTLRSDIDEVDDEIIRLLGERMELAKKIGGFKQKHDIVVVQLQRWREIIASRKSLGIQVGLTEEFIEEFLSQLHHESIRKQTNIINDHKKNSEDGVAW